MNSFKIFIACDAVDAVGGLMTIFLIMTKTTVVTTSSIMTKTGKLTQLLATQALVIFMCGLILCCENATNT